MSLTFQGLFSLCVHPTKQARAFLPDIKLRAPVRRRFFQISFVSVPEKRLQIDWNKPSAFKLGVLRGVSIFRRHATRGKADIPVGSAHLLGSIWCFRDRFPGQRLVIDQRIIAPFVTFCVAVIRPERATALQSPRQNEDRPFPPKTLNRGNSNSR